MKSESKILNLLKKQVFLHAVSTRGSPPLDSLKKIDIHHSNKMIKNIQQNKINSIQSIQSRQSVKQTNTKCDVTNNIPLYNDTLHHIEELGFAFKEYYLQNSKKGVDNKGYFASKELFENIQNKRGSKRGGQKAMKKKPQKKNNSRKKVYQK